MNVSAADIAQALNARKSGNGWIANCVAHEDKNPSMSIAEGDKGRPVVHCHAGCEKSAVIEALRDRKLWPQSDDDQIPTAHFKLGAYSKHWDYHDATGRHVMRVCRWDRPDGKEIRPLTLRGERWEWKAFEDHRPLYRLPALKDTIKRVLIVEGEKTAEAAQKFFPDLTATTWSGGAKAINKTDWKPLANRDVTLVADNDAPGARAMDAVAAILRTYDCTVRRADLLPLGDLPKGWDIADALGDRAFDLDALAGAIEKASAIGSLQNTEIEPLIIAPASALVGRDPPPPRDWVIEDLALAAGRVTSFIGNGGFGKTTIAAQLSIAVATARSLYGMAVNGGPVLGVFCEDEQPDIDRRILTICQAEGIEIASLTNLYALSRDGADNVLCTFNRDQIELTPFYWKLDATIARIKPRLSLIDTAADVFAGDFMSTPHVRQFIKVALGGLCARHGTAILLLAHPSASAMASGDGGGFSTAWNNSVRSRLYLRRPKSDDEEATADRRVLEIKKSNYGPTGATIPLIFDRGRFTLDPDPIEENAKPVKAAKSDTRLALAVMSYFRVHASSGQVVMFRAVFEALQRSGDVPAGSYETVRKPLQRTLKALVDDKLLQQTDVPRGGYRIVITIGGAE